MPALADTLRKYRIQAFSEITGVNAATLRAWERRYGLPKPARTQLAYRLYSDEDADQIRQMVELTHQGLAPAQAAKAVLEQEEQPQAPLSPAVDEFELLRERLLSDVIANDPGATSRTAAYVFAITSPTQAFDRVFDPVLQEVGERWARGDMTMAQEHLLTSVVGSAVSGVAGLVRPQPDSGHVVLACVEGELHAIGLRGLELHLASFGIRTTILGQRSPPEVIEEAARSMSPDAVGLSMTVMPSGSPTKLFRAYGKACGDVPWAVGGPVAARYGKAIGAAGGELCSGRGRAAASQLAGLARKRSAA